MPDHMMKTRLLPLRRLLAAGLALCLPAIGTPLAQAREGWHSAWQERAAPPSQVAATCDNAGFLTAQNNFEQGGPKGDTPVHICGTVLTLAPVAKKTRSGVHGYFYVAVTPTISIRVVANLDEMRAPAWPWVAKGDHVEVIGRYYYDSYRRQGIDWTHHGTGRSWNIPGSVTVNGTRYD